MSLEPDSARRVYDGRLLGLTVERWGEHEREIVEHPGAVAVVAKRQAVGVFAALPDGVRLLRVCHVDRGDRLERGAGRIEGVAIR